MEKGKELLTKSIIIKDNNLAFSPICIKNLILDYKTNQLLGFLINNTDNPDQNDILPFEQVEKIDPQGIVVGSKPVILADTQTEHIQQALTNQIVLEGRPVVTPEGEYLGRLQDLYLNPRTGKIEGYEVKNQGYPQKTSLFVQAVKVDCAQENSIALIQTAATTQLVEAGNSICQTVSDALVNAKPFSLTLRQSQPPLPQPQNQTASRSRIKPFVSRPLERVKGRRVRRQLCDRQGKTLAIPGQIVTQRLLEKAKRQNLGKQLCAAVGLGNLAAPKRHPRPAQPSSGQSLDCRVKQALGHPVTQHIQDDRGNTILNVGDLITYEAVDLAKKAKVLHLVLDAVYQSPKTSTRSPD